jgi:hypothetical protein
LRFKVLTAIIVFIIFWSPLRRSYRCPQPIELASVTSFNTYNRPKLDDFYRLNSVHNNIQFIMDTETDGHIFLDIDVYRKLDGSLGQREYRKPSHTNLYLNATSHHHPATKQAVLSTLVHHAKAVCDANSLPQGLKFLRATFRNNGYGENKFSALSIHRRETDCLPCTQLASSTCSDRHYVPNILSAPLRPPRFQASGLGGIAGLPKDRLPGNPAVNDESIDKCVEELSRAIQEALARLLLSVVPVPYYGPLYPPELETKYALKTG